MRGGDLCVAACSGRQVIRTRRVLVHGLHVNGIVRSNQDIWEFKKCWHGQYGRAVVT